MVVHDDDDEVEEEIESVHRNGSPSPLISAFLFVRDEAATLERAFASISDLDAEIIVGVDVASRDNTREISARWAHKVLDVDFEGDLGGDFAAARNRLNAVGSGTWGLTLDGHEFFAAGHACALRALLEAPPPEYQGIALGLRMSEAEGGERALVLRCWRRSPHVRYERPVHENLVGLGEAVLGRPDIVIHHDRPQLRAEERKAQRFRLDLHNLRTRVESHPDDLVSTWNLARTLIELGDLHGARLLAERVLDGAAARKTVFRVRVLLHLGQVALRYREWEEAIRRANEALLLHWNSAEAWAIVAEATAGIGDVQRAVFALNAMMLLPEGPPELPVAARYATWWPHVQMARLALSQGRVELAARSFQIALGFDLPHEVRTEAAPWAGLKVQVGGRT